MCIYEFEDPAVGTSCGYKLAPNTRTNFCQDIIDHQWIPRHYNCITSSLIILYKYPFTTLCDLRMASFIILQNYIVSGAHLLLPWRQISVCIIDHGWDLHCYQIPLLIANHVTNHYWIQRQRNVVMMSLGIRPPGKGNEKYANMRRFTSPEEVKADKRLDIFNVGSIFP